MSTKGNDEASVESVRETISRLRLPVPQLPELLELLSAPLAAVGLLPKEYTVYNTRPFRNSLSPAQTRWIPTIQSVILQQIVPSWEVPLSNEGYTSILEHYFCPTPKGSSFSFEIALNAYSSLLGFPISRFSIRVLTSLARLYPIDELHDYLFGRGTQKSKLRTIDWEELVRAVVAVPSKVANATPDHTPPELQSKLYTEDLCRRFENIVYQISNHSASTLSSSSQQPVNHLLAKLVQTGCFPQHNSDPLRTSFFSCCLPTIMSRLRSENAQKYSATWSSLFLSLSSSSMQSFLSSLISILPVPSNPLSADIATRRLVKDNAGFLRGILGPLSLENDEIWVPVSGVLIGRIWNEFIARVVVVWASGGQHETSEEDTGIEELAIRVLDVWSSTQHNKNVVITRHKYITSLLMLSVHYLPINSGFLKGLAVSPALLSSISKYLGNLDPTVRRIGMAVAEDIAKLSGKQLDFGGWDGNEQGRGWIRELRTLVKERDGSVQDATADSDDEDVASEPTVPEPSSKSLPTPSLQPKPPTGRVYDSDDDSLSGYGSSPSSSRAASPTPSELEEIEKDPTLRVGGGLNKTKITRPVYLATLGELLLPTKAGQEDEFQKLEMGLLHAEELIRRKRDYGTELEENAANLTITLVGLQDNFDMDHFDDRRQAALIALVACCPRISSPCIIEQFFHNQYSTAQRFAMLTALAIGARELAGLPVDPTITPKKTVFPSKMLPPALHQKYLAADDLDGSTTQVALLADGISRMALERGRQEAEEKVPQIIREKQLRVRKPAPNIVDLGAAQGARGSRIPVENVTQPATAFKDVAAEYFIIPLIERFWLHLRDEQTRETRSKYSAASAYRGAGTGMILDALVLRQLISTLSVLLHAARHSPAFLPVLAPEGLELAVTMGTRPASVAAPDKEDEDGAPGKIDKEVSVLASSFELALVVLDASVDLDGGRELGLEKTRLLLATREWASEVFRRLEESGGIEIDDGSGDALNRVRRGAAGVLLKIEEVMDRWKRSMITF